MIENNQFIQGDKEAYYGMFEGIRGSGKGGMSEGKVREVSQLMMNE